MSNTFSTDSTNVKKARPALSSVFAKYVVTAFWLRAAGEVRNRPGYGSVSEEERRASRVMKCSPVWNYSPHLVYVSDTEREGIFFFISLPGEQNMLTKTIKGGEGKKRKRKY